MTYEEIYRQQVQLLIGTLPYVAEEDCFALKGGTAINLFIRAMPRLSVDIDLTYLPDNDREGALNEIDAALKRIAARIERADPTMQLTLSAPGSQRTINKLIVRRRDRVQIKIEVTPVLRGTVYEPELLSVVDKVEEEFGFAEIKVVSFPDLYAGKIMAALDRQHPRDLYDIHLLLQNEGIDDKLRLAFIVYLISHDQSPHTLLVPSTKDITHEYQTGFVGMTAEDIALETLLDARTRLVEDLLINMPAHHKEFLISFYNRSPAWDLLGPDHLQQLPAVRWRELNLNKAGKATRSGIVDKLEKLFAEADD